mmetsp:Transcript_42783/g.129597  ORF Transcript_42783/g.129597 Transcript_42783/m.129597 type:complete len:317 (-) Transcript_42783:52-1002(-)
MRLAVLISGLLDRLVLPPLLRDVVATAKAPGYHVDVFMSLSNTSRSQATWFTDARSVFIGEPLLRGVPSEKVGTFLEQQIRAAGGGLPYFELLDVSDDIDHLPKERRPRLRFYSPFLSSVGKNLLRRYRSLERLWDQVQLAEQKGSFNYDYLLVAREDVAWINPLRLDRMGLNQNVGVVYSVNCRQYGGINDKVLLMDRAAAPSMMRPYTEWYQNPSRALDKPNAEQFLQAVAFEHGVYVVEPPLSVLLAESAMYQAFNGSQPALCSRKTMRAGWTSCPKQVANLPLLPDCRHETPAVATFAAPMDCSDADLYSDS